MATSNSMTFSRKTVKMEIVHSKSSKSVDYITKNQLTRYSAPIKLGSYLIKNVIGKGAFGTVYRCKNEKNKFSNFGIKTFNKKNMKKSEFESVLSEIEILSKLPSHPHCVEFIESVQNEYFIGIVLPFYPNGSLYSFIKEFGVGMLTELHCKAFLFQILSAVAFLHQNDVIHRDIKAANVLINSDGMCVLCDFGIAQYVKNDIVNAGDVSSIIGTPNWMAPEIIEMKQVTTASDIWSIGATAIELFTGFPPYSNLYPMGALFRIVEDEYPPIPQQISVLFEDFLYLCFCKDPKERPTANEMLKHKWLRDVEFEY